MIKRTIPLIAAVAIVLTTTLCMVWLRSARGAGENDEHASHGQEAEVAADPHAGHDHGDETDAHEDEGLHLDGLETMRVEERIVPTYLTLAAEVEANAEKTARVGSPVDGRIVSLKARVGDTVSANQTLAIVASRDVADVKAALGQARARESAASGQLRTLRALADSGALTQGPAEDARREQTAAQAAADEAVASLDRAEKARASAVAELERVKKLAKAKAFSAAPVESAKRDVASAKAEFASAGAAIRVRQAAYDRAQRLFDSGLVAKRDVETAEAELAQAQAESQEAQAHLEIAQSALSREQGISGQDLYAIREVADAQNGLDDAEKGVRSAKVELDRAKRHLRLTQTVLSREERVAKGRLHARRELQSVEAELILARAEVKAAQAGLSAFSAAGGKMAGGSASIAIVTPRAGVVTARDVSEGQAIQASQDLFTIEGIDPVWVWASAYEKDLSQVPVGAAVQVRVPSYPEVEFAGKVTHIARALDRETRTARVRCEVENSEGLLQPGMFASAAIEKGVEKSAILLPRKAVLDEAGGQVVFIACDDCPEDKRAGKSVCGAFDKVSVETGDRHGDRIEVLSGLRNGAMAVITGQYQLKTALGGGTLEAGCTDH